MCLDSYIWTDILGPFSAVERTDGRLHSSVVQRETDFCDFSKGFKGWTERLLAERRACDGNEGRKKLRGNMDSLFLPLLFPLASVGLSSDLPSCFLMHREDWLARIEALRQRGGLLPPQNCKAAPVIALKSLSRPGHGPSHQAS